jgi:hypothetical protein
MVFRASLEAAGEGEFEDWSLTEATKYTEK